MLDGRLRPLIDPPLDRAGRALAARGVTADAVTLAGLFYGAIPLGFVLLDPTANAVAGSVLLLAVYVNGASFLGFAILAEKRGLETGTQGVKNLYYSGGLLEGTETIGFFVMLCLWPDAFAPLAFGFAALCFLTALTRVLYARRVFAETWDDPAGK